MDLSRCVRAVEALQGAEAGSAVIGCEECGNDDATVTLDDGRQVCLECAEEDALIAWLERTAKARHLSHADE